MNPTIYRKGDYFVAYDPGDGAGDRACECILRRDPDGAIHLVQSTTSPTFAQRVEMARSLAIMNGEKPVYLRLGYREYAELREAMRKGAVEKGSGPGRQFRGLEVLMSGHENHLSVSET